MADQSTPTGASDAPQQPQDGQQPQVPQQQPAPQPAQLPVEPTAAQPDQFPGVPQPAQPQAPAPQQPVDATVVQPQPVQPADASGAAPVDATQVAPDAPVPGAPAPGVPDAPMDTTQVAPGMPVPGAPADAAQAGSTVAPGGPAVPGMPGAPGAQAAPGAPAPKKKMSKGLIAAIVALVVLVVGVSAFLIVRNNAIQKAEAKIEDTANSIVSADDSLYGLDAYAKIDSGFDTDLNTDDGRNNISDANADLDDAEASLNEAKQSEWALDDAGKSTISTLEAGIQSRRNATDAAGKLMDATDQAKTVSDDANTFLTDYNATYVYLGLADYAFGQAATAANSDINSLDTSSTSSYLDKCSSALKQTKKDLDALEQDAPDADFSSYKDAYDSLSTTIDDYIALIDKLNQKDLAGAQSIAQTLDSQVDDLKKKSKAMDSVSSALKKLVTDDDKQNAKSLKSDFNDIDSNVSDLSDDPLVGDTMSTSKFA